MKLKKYILLGFFLFLINMNIVSAGDKINVTLNKCVDGDTAWFNVGDEIIKTRFLAIDTPESTNKKEPYGKEASTFTCNALTNAKTIILEYDDESDKTDKYDRHLVWLWIDDTLFQKEILKNGLAEVKYLYGDYDYTEELQQIEAKAKENKLNIWNEETSKVETEEEMTFEEYIYFIISLVAVLIMLMNKKGRKKLNNKIKKRLKNVR